MNAFEDLTPRQRAYKAKREEQHQQIVDCIKEAGLRSIHKKGAYRATGIRERILNAMIDDMHRRRLIHIAGWTFCRSCCVALFAIGNKPDVERVLPQLTTKAHKQKERRHGAAPLNEEEQLRVMVDKKHRAWAKQWKPHRDPAAAWF